MSIISKYSQLNTLKFDCVVSAYSSFCIPCDFFFCSAYVSVDGSNMKSSDRALETCSSVTEMKLLGEESIGAFFVSHSVSSLAFPGIG